MRPFCGTTALAVFALLGVSNIGVSQDAAGPKFAKWLTDRGYVEVKLAETKGGWLDVKVDVDGQAMLLVLDTGANNINLDRASAKRAKLTIKESEDKSSALGGDLPTGRTKIGKLAIGECASPFDAYVIDLSSVNASRKASDDPPCDGILGGSYLTHYSAIIDYANLNLYLLNAEESAKKIGRQFGKRGYIEVPVTLNKTGLLDVTVQVDDRLLLLFLDTGYPTAVSLDRASAKWANLQVKETAGKTAVLGGNASIGQAKIARLSVGGLASTSDAEVVDWSATNATRKNRGDPLCDGILGGGFFKKHSALIDYAGLKLYLREAARK